MVWSVSKRSEWIQPSLLPERVCSAITARTSWPRARRALRPARQGSSFVTLPHRPVPLFNMHPSHATSVAIWLSRCPWGIFEGLIRIRKRCFSCIWGWFSVCLRYFVCLCFVLVVFCNMVHLNSFCCKYCMHVTLSTYCSPDDNQQRTEPYTAINWNKRVLMLKDYLSGHNAPIPVEKTGKWSLLNCLAYSPDVLIGQKVGLNRCPKTKPSQNTLLFSSSTKQIQEKA